MFKLVSVLCVLVALSAVQVHSQSCSDTSGLRSLYNFDNSITTAKSYSDLKYCKSIKSSPVCCTNTDINNFATKSAEIITNLTNIVGTRDLYLKTVKDVILPGMVQSLNSFAPLVQQLLGAFQNMPGFNMSDVADFSDMIAQIQNTTDMIVSSLAALKTSYTGYQKSRTSCVVEMVKLQNAAFCLACDPSAASKGFSQTSYGFNFGLSTRVCNRLKGSCKAYFEGSDVVNELLGAAYAAPMLTGLVTSLQAAINGNFTALEDVFGDGDGDSNYTTTFDGSENAYLIPVSTPYGCDEGGDCNWICTDLFIDGEIDQDALALGGVFNFTSDSFGFRLLQNADKSGDRMLTSGDFDPDSDEAGVTVTFKDDPANTNSSKFGRLTLGNMFMGVMAVICSVLLL